MSSRKRRSWLAVLPRIVGGLVVLAACLAVAGKYWILPTIVQSQLRLGLRRVWDGPVEVGQVEFNYFGPIRLARLDLNDRDGRTWLAVRDLTCVLTDWPGTDATLTDVVAGRAEVTLYVKDGRITPPIRPLPDDQGRFLREHVDIQRIKLVSGRLHVFDDWGVEARFSGISLAVARQGGAYRASLTHVPSGGIRLTRNGEAGGVVQDVRVSVTVDPGAPQPIRLDAEGRFDLQFPQAFLENLGLLEPASAGRGAELVAGTEAPPGPATKPASEEYKTFRLRGQFTVDVAAAGDLARPQDLTPTGKARLFSCTADGAEGHIARAAELAVVIDGWGGRVVRGRVASDSWSAELKDTKFRYDGKTKRLLADVKLAGKLHHDSRRESFWAGRLWLAGVQGTAELAGPVAIDPDADQPVIMDLRGRGDLETLDLPTVPPLRLTKVHCGDVRLTGGSLEVPIFVASAYQGRVGADLTAAWTPGSAAVWTGNVEARNINMPQLSRALDAEKPMATGVGSASYAFVVQAGKLDSLCGRGRVLIDNADLWHIPVMSVVFASLKLPHRESDAQIAFTMRGPVATIGSGRVANPLSALVAEPGGTVNLDNRQVDLVAAVALVKHLRSLLGSVPGVSLLMSVKDKFTRVRLKGTWDAPTSELVLVLPAKDITAGTLDILKKAAAAGGQLGEGLFKPLAKLLHLPQTPKKPQR